MKPVKREEENSQMIDRLVEQQLNNALVTKKIREESKREIEEVKKEVTAEMHNEIDQTVRSVKSDMREFVNAAIEEVKQIVPLSDGEATKLKSAISSRATVTTNVWLNWKFGDKEYGGQELFSKKYGHIIRAFYGLVKKQFDAIKYTTILHANIDEAIKYANSLNIRSLNSKTLRITESQLKTINQWEKDRNLPLTPSDN